MPTSGVVRQGGRRFLGGRGGSNFRVGDLRRDPALVGVAVTAKQATSSEGNGAGAPMLSAAGEGSVLMLEHVIHKQHCRP